jgi:hypothetical protein
MSTIKIGEAVMVPGNDTAGLSLVSGVGVPKNAQSSFQARFLRVQVGPSVYMVQMIPQSGEDVSPPVRICNSNGSIKTHGSLIAILESAGIRLGVAVQDNVPPSVTLNSGEKEWYGSDGSGVKLARIKAKLNGKLYVGNTTQNLRTQVDNLLVALNTFSGAGAQSSITTGGASSSALAAAIVALMQPLFTAVNNVQTALDALLDASE